ncbi:ATP-binding protein [Cupriavidus sp. CuC1]|uniref:ATP-binding protein n=1 Tax=Cupriavidus sp. CuC1 TaxID=3373131 RepID=UPI0037D36151
MRLADYILHDVESILAQWEAFAGTQLPASASMTPLALRDHAEQILRAVAKDLSTFQTKIAQAEKSRGLAPQLLDATETAAQTHAHLRLRSGFDINQLAAEYRALRASVLRLWIDDCHPDAPDLDDVIRFNEAIDQALAESIGLFTAQVDQARNLFLGMLGHDMRSPLHIIQLTAAYLGSVDAEENVSGAAQRLVKSGARLKALLDDLLDFNRTTLGLRINLGSDKVDLANLFAEELAQLRSAHPGHGINLEVKGDTKGVWDGRRLQQLLGNLVVNAIKYGAPDEPVRVVVAGDEREVRFEVRNSGRAIEQSTLAQLFDPLKRAPEHESSQTADGSLGLGLYIAREIARAHGGEITALSDQTVTVFAVRLPRCLDGAPSTLSH